MISSDLMDVWWSLCRRTRREKKRQESIISRKLESCAGASVDLDVAKMRFKNLRFVAISVSCFGASVDLDVVSRKDKFRVVQNRHFLFYPPYKKRLAPPTGGVRIIERNFVTYCFANMQ